MIGYMGNNLLPLRAGEVVRVYVVSRHGPRFWTTVATIVVERVLDGLALGLIVAGLLLVVPVPAEMRWSITIFLAVDLAGLLVLAMIAVAPGVCRVLIETIFHRIGLARAAADRAARDDDRGAPRHSGAPPRDPARTELGSDLGILRAVGVDRDARGPPGPARWSRPGSCWPSSGWA